MVITAERKRTTYADYLKIDDNNRYEVLEGELKMAPASNTVHQSVSRNLEFLIWSFVKKKGTGQVFYAPIDVVLDDDVVLQPDIVYVSNDNLNIICKNAIQGTPDLAIEIVSPSSVFYDTVEKKEVYRKYGVVEYWLVFPDEKVVEVFVLENEKYKEFCRAKKKGTVISKLLSRLSIDLKEVF